MAYHCPFTSHHLLTVIKFSIINYQLSINKMNKPFIIDAHLDLSMNALEWNRDLRQPLKEINRREIGMTDKPDRGNATISFEELRKGNVGLVVATHKKALEAHLALWKDGEPADKKPIGYVLSIEGADSFITVNHVERAYAYGLRAVGPAHYGPGRYANGTDSTGHLNAMGKELLRTMDRLGMILDVTHLCDEAFWDALDLYKGPIWASHNNCRAFVDHNRQFSDEMIKALIERGAVIGIALVSAAFTGTAIARMVGHNQNRYAMAAVGGIAAGALTALPLMGSFVSGVAFVFTLGYVIQIIWRNARLKPQQTANTPGLPSA